MYVFVWLWWLRMWYDCVCNEYGGVCVMMTVVVVVCRVIMCMMMMVVVFECVMMVLVVCEWDDGSAGGDVYVCRSVCVLWWCIMMVLVMCVFVYVCLVPNGIFTCFFMLDYKCQQQSQFSSRLVCILHHSGLASHFIFPKVTLGAINLMLVTVFSSISFWFHYIKQILNTVIINY